jgi:hypothetical protein
MTDHHRPDRLYETGRGGTGYPYTEQLADLAAMPTDEELAAGAELAERPLLGLATTRELIAELEARLRIARIVDADAIPAPPAGELELELRRALDELPDHVLDYRTAELDR